jgi:hypothetical protein
MLTTLTFLTFASKVLILLGLLGENLGELLVRNTNARKSGWISGE